MKLPDLQINAEAHALVAALGLEIITAIDEQLRKESK